MIEKLEEFLEWGGTRKNIVCLILSAIALVISIFDLVPLPFDASWIAIVLCGVPIILEAIIGLVTEFDIKADVLVSIALIASIIIREDFAAGEVAFIMQLGALLEDLTVAKARAGIEKLVHLTPRTARVIGTNLGNQGAETEKIIPAENVKIGDLLRVLPGETVPVDGVIVSGQTSINQAVMTGESLPVDKSVGDEVSSGTVNQFGAFDMRATRVGEDSSIQRMIRLVQSADAGKAKIVSLADRWATWIVVTALTASVLTWFVTGQIIRSVTILVVFCPCALVLATPTAIMAAIGNATSHGFLVREGDALERLAQVTDIAFDKTGTLTFGTPEVQAVHSSLPEISDQELYWLSACAEQKSEHPLGKAVVRCFKKEKSTGQDVLAELTDFEMIPGRGVRARIDGTGYLKEACKGVQKFDSEQKYGAISEKIPADVEILAGNEELLREWKIELPQEIDESADTYRKEGCTIIYLAVGGRAGGFLALSDTVRPDAKKTIAEICEAKVTPVLLTGDHLQSAETIANRIGIKQFRAECLPEDKLRFIEESQKSSHPVCMIGDGINDAPALKKAHVGIAMGGVGSDIAVDAADIALVNDEIRELPHLLLLARRMMFTIRCNLTFSMTLNFIAIVLAITGKLNPVAGALVHNSGSVFVIINSALLLKWRKKS
ncbi:heavy metal translocating P-type ATPase [Brotaphodocola sp.]|uniref:heavy metal translocating P-type ATPase n=1 Tax=Brotaphodocola sp. TaxID=3073577 RepID=UPI003D7D0FEE